MQTEPSKAEPPKRKRRWFQFSLRTLMIFTLVCAIPCAWLGRKIEQKHKEREAIAAVVNSGGIVKYDYEDANRGKPAGPAWLRTLLGQDFFSDVVYVIFVNGTDRELTFLEGLPELQTVILTGGRFSDAGLAQLSGLQRLRFLGFFESKVSGADFLQIKKLAQLDELAFYERSITDEGLKSVGVLIHLHTLLINNAPITDAGLASLEGLTELKRLVLHKTDVSDLGLRHLKGMTQLEQLDLSRTKVTDAGVEKLQDALTKCTVER